jgi:hypothetical protein
MLKFSRTDLWEASIFEHLASIPDADNHTIPLYDVITPPGAPEAPAEWCIVITPRLTDCRNRHFDKLRDFIDFLSQVLEVSVMLKRLLHGSLPIFLLGCLFYAPVQYSSHVCCVVQTYFFRNS